MAESQLIGYIRVSTLNQTPDKVFISGASF